MAKKTSRAVRVQQGSRQQDTKREISARPIVGSHTIGGTSAGNNQTAVAPEPFKMSISAHDLADTSVKPAPVAAPIPVARPAVSNNTVLPRRFLNAQPRQNATISREEEYRYIRADLVTVLVLAILMVVALVVLTILIGR